MTTQWIILRAGQPIYRTTSYPRFMVQLLSLTANGNQGIDWTTDRVPSSLFV